MAIVVDQKSQAMPIGRVVSRGLVAAHGVLVGALYLFLLHAPSQVLGAVAQAFQIKPGQPPDPMQLLLAVLVGFGSLVFTLAVFFLFPLVQGGILGQVRDRLESPEQPPGHFSHYGRTFYVRLLGSEGLFVLAVLLFMVPAMCLSAALGWQALAMYAEPGQPPPSQPPDPQQLTRHLMMHPLFLVGMAVLSLLLSAVGMVYWLANCIVVREKERVLASWEKALSFCRQNFSAVLAVWFLTVALGLLLCPLGMLGQLGVVKDLWVLVPLALLYAALIGYLGVLLAGVNMSLYLARRPASGQSEPGPEPVRPSGKNDVTIPVARSPGGRSEP
jgi:hypothetical protein